VSIQMKRILTPALVALAAVALVQVAVAADVPFPAVHSGNVFVIAQTVTTDGAMNGYFAPGNSVVFRAYAVDGKTHKVLTADAVKFFYATIPNQPNVKFKYDPKAPGASGQYAWTGTWTVPADYPTGLVNFKVLVKSKAKRTGSFVQMPVATSQLTISKTPQLPPGTGPGGTPGTTGKVTTVIYADSVNGTRPAGAAPRPIGCTQTNVFKRGEQFVLRTWGFDLASGAVLSIDNVTEAHFTVAGQPNVTLNWGSHGTAKVFFWTNAWNIPAAYPLGDTVVHISFALTSGKAATLDYPITIIP
jgi:hypothetical protein